MNNLPVFYNKLKICIICEGNEEYFYLERLKELKVWNMQYDIKLINAEGNGNIPARYQDRYSSDSYDLVLVFCDTEKKPYEQYNDIKRKINEFHGIKDVADELIIFGNPCTMQIVSKHWTEENLNTSAKRVNAPLICRFTGVENYKAKANQIEKVMQFITKENYYDMKQRIQNLKLDDSITGSSNFKRFLKYLEADNSSWIQKINEKLLAETE